MSIALRVDVPAIPPSTNHLYVGTGAHRHRTDAYVAWLDLVIPLTRLERQKTGWQHQDGRLYRLTIWLQFPSRRRADADNRIKAAADALAAALGMDDEVFRDSRALHCGIAPRRPRTLMLLEPLPGAPQWGVV